VPDAGLVLDYNRYMYVRGNPLKYTDPTGNSACVALGPQLGILCQAVEVIQRYGPAVVAAAGGLASAAGLTAALDVTADDDASATDLYPTPAVDGSTITSSFPLPGSTTVTIQGVPLVQQEPSPDYATPSDSAATFHTEEMVEGFSTSNHRSAQELITYISPSESPFWQGLGKYRGDIRQDGSGRKKQYYTWDYLHGEIEYFDRNGNHLGALDPQTGEVIKPAVSGRSIREKLK
jgi:hypothetical protein